LFIKWINYFTKFFGMTSGMYTIFVKGLNIYGHKINLFDGKKIDKNRAIKKALLSGLIH